MTQESFYISKDQGQSSMYECFSVILSVFADTDTKILNLQFVIPIQLTLENKCCKCYWQDLESGNFYHYFIYIRILRKSTFISIFPLFCHENL